ncbi:MAG: hypothetical protein V2A72_05155 [Candidatus Omnitrophota bacterium]
MKKSTAGILIIFLLIGISLIGKGFISFYSGQRKFLTPNELKLIKKIAKEDIDKKVKFLIQQGVWSNMSSEERLEDMNYGKNFDSWKQVHIDYNIRKGAMLMVLGCCITLAIILIRIFFIKVE